MAEKLTYEELELRVQELEKSELKRKQDVVALNESEAKFDNLLKNVPLPYQSLDENGNFLEVNQFLQNVLGYDQEELIGRNFVEFLHPDWVDYFKENFPKFKKVGEVFGVEFEMIRNDGVAILVSLNGFIQRNDQNHFQRTHCFFQDITEHRKAEKALQASEKKYRTLFENMVQGVFYQNADGVLTDYNNAALEMFGLTPEQFIGKTSLDPQWKVINEDGTDLVGDKHPSMIALQTGKPVLDVTVGVYNPKTKTFKWLVVNAIPQFNKADGKAYRVFVTLQDCTEARRSAENLRKNEALFRELYNNITSGSAIYEVINDGQKGSDFIIKSFNIKGLELEGKTIGEVVGKSLFDLRPSIDDYGIIPVMRQVWKTGESAHFPVKIYQDNEFSNYYENYIFKLPSGEVVTIYDDVTEQKNADDHLRESEENYRLLVENQTDMIVKVDLEGKFQFASPSYLKTFGKKPEDLLGKSYMPLVHPEDQELTAKAMEELFSPPHTIYLEQRAMTSNGWRWLAWADTAVLDGMGNVTGIIGVGRDITEQKKVIQERKQLQKKLLQAQKMEAIGLMAGGVAHDLNNILSGIVSYPDLLLRQLPQESTLRKPIEAIQQSGKRAAEVVGDMLTVARGSASQKEITNLNKLVTEYIQSPEGQTLFSHYSKVTIVTKLAADLLNLSCSATHIKKCLMNLVTNAAEAISNTGKIVVSTRNQYIEEPIVSDQYVERGEYVVVSCRDSGPGIAAEDISKIFEPFYTKKALGRSGTGLGLAIVWTTVHEHGGIVTVNSDNKGTNIELYFPISREKTSNLVQVTKPEQVIGNNEHILIVDDEPQQRDIARQILESLSYQVNTVCSGEDALQFLKKEAVDLVVLDMIMGTGLNGRKTYEKILHINPKQKAIIASGFAENNEVKKALNLGVKTFIQKPYTLESFGQVVKNALKHNSSLK